MAGIEDLLARATAAQGRTAMPAGGGPEGALSPEGAAPLPEEAMMAGGAPDLESALAGVEASLEGMDPKLAEEIRDHLNAIREIASQDVGKEAPPKEGESQLPDEMGAPAGGESIPTGEGQLPLA